MNYRELDKQLQGRNRDARKLANNTYAQRRELHGDNVIAIRLHSTDILTFFRDGSVKVDTGGWQTVTTKERLNRYLPDGIGITQDRRVWYWLKNGERVALFTEGDTISPEGNINAQRHEDAIKGINKLKARIARYAKLCGAKIPLDRPNNGDCLYCNVLLQSQNGQTLGDETKDREHLMLHMRERYVVPSLVYQAMKEKGMGPAWYWEAFKGENGEKRTEESYLLDSARKEIASAVTKFMSRRLGLAS
jgi:hypothetical protein